MFELDKALAASGFNPIYVDENTDINAEIRKRETNEEFVRRIMNYCPQGPLIQAIVIEALSSYADHFRKDENRLPEKGFIHPDAWQAACQWLHDELGAKYAGR